MAHETEDKDDSSKRDLKRNNDTIGTETSYAKMGVTNTMGLYGVNNVMRLNLVRNFWNIDGVNTTVTLAGVAFSVDATIAKFDLSWGWRTSLEKTSKYSSWRRFNATRSGPFSRGFFSDRAEILGENSKFAEGERGEGQNEPNLSKLFAELYSGRVPYKETDVEKYEYTKTDGAVAVKRGTFYEYKNATTYSYTSEGSVTYELDEGAKYTRRKEKKEELVDSYTVCLVSNFRTAENFHNDVVLPRGGERYKTTPGDTLANFEMAKKGDRGTITLKVPEGESGASIVLSSDSITLKVGESKIVISNEGVQIGGIDFGTHIHKRPGIGGVTTGPEAPPAR